DVLVATRRGGSLIALARPRIQGAVVAIDPRSGAVLASVGGYDPAVSGFDRTVAMRQPGSAIKPFLYGAALDLGIDPRSSIANTPETFVEPGGVRWTPGNYDGKSSPEIPMWSALEQSSNLAAAHLIHRIAPASLARVAGGAGVYEPGQMDLRLTAALGAYETTLTDLVQGYATLVNDAIPRQDLAIDRVDGPAGPMLRRPVWSAPPVIGGAAQSDLISMLRGVVTRGTAASAMRGAPVAVAGKTGTSQAYRDAWFVGVTPHLAIGVWLGRDDSRPMPGSITGGKGPARTVRAILDAAHEAGLIDGNGYRDERLTSGGDWPPQTISSAGWQVSGAVAPAAPVAPPVRADEGFILERGGSPYYEERRPVARSGGEYYQQQAPVRQPVTGTSYFDQ
ncbi:transglycosylase domain-containing protein, partial [Palleronia sp.]|uniref:transglycosylase domain-containing protein n=1 Tax=Palleronia sp. TaxID=1940284 RepID=UPI0035C85B7A